MSALLAFILRLSGAWELRDGADGATVAWFTDRTTAREAARLLALRTWRPMRIQRRGSREDINPTGAETLRLEVRNAQTGRWLDQLSRPESAVKP